MSSPTPAKRPRRTRAMAMLNALEEIKTRFEADRQRIRNEWMEKQREVAFDDSMPVPSDAMRQMDDLRREFNLVQARTHTAELIWHALVEVYENHDDEGGRLGDPLEMVGQEEARSARERRARDSRAVEGALDERAEADRKAMRGSGDGGRREA